MLQNIYLNYYYCWNIFQFQLTTIYSIYVLRRLPSYHCTQRKNKRPLMSNLDSGDVLGKKYSLGSFFITFEHCHILLYAARYGVGMNKVKHLYLTPNLWKVVISGYVSKCCFYSRFKIEWDMWFDVKWIDKELFPSDDLFLMSKSTATDYFPFHGKLICQT